MVQAHSLHHRSVADPSVPKAPNPLVLKAWTITASLIAVAGIPFYLLNYILNNPGIPLRMYLISCILRRLGRLVPQLVPPETEEARWTIPTTMGGNSNLWAKLVEVPPAPDSAFRAYASIPSASPIVPLKMPGYLLNGDGPAKPNEVIFLYFHGGAYIRGHPLWTGLPCHLARDLNIRVFAGQYRKCLTPETTFPGPLIDALAAWNYVTGTLGFPPSQVIIGGDSAGGHLSISLLQQLGALGAPLPGGAVLLSPWADGTFSFPSWKSNSETDFLTIRKVINCIKSVAQFYTPDALSGPFFSPALAPEGHWTFLEHVPILVTVGTAEVFHDEDQALVSAMRRDGVHVEVQTVSVVWSQC